VVKETLDALFLAPEETIFSENLMLHSMYLSILPDFFRKKYGKTAKPGKGGSSDVLLVRPLSWFELHEEHWKVHQWNPSFAFWTSGG
jgi:hypothetical protein